MINTDTIGKIIKKLRVDNNLTQEELAEKIDISTNYLSKVERGLSKLNVEAFLRMAEVLSFSLSDFGINAPTKSSENAGKQKLLEKVLATPEKDIDIYFKTLDFAENLISNVRKS